MDLFRHQYLAKTFNTLAFVMSLNTVQAAVTHPGTSPKNFTPKNATGMSEGKMATHTLEGDPGGKETAAESGDYHLPTPSSSFSACLKGKAPSQGVYRS